jgi:Type IV secretion system proteins
MDWAARCLVAAVIAGGCISSMPRQADAQVPVTDAAANASLVTQITHQVQMLSNLAQQVTALTNLVSLASIAGTVLGDTVSPELTGLFNASQGAYNASNQAYGSIFRVPGRVDAELGLFQPPAAGWESMSFYQLMTRAKQLRELTANTNSAAVSRQADLIEQRALREQQAMRANALADTSISALSATQAVAQQMRVTGQILGQIEQTNSDISSNIALQMQSEETQRQIGEALVMKDLDNMQQMISQGPGTMQTNPIRW